MIKIIKKTAFVLSLILLFQCDNEKKIGWGENYNLSNDHFDVEIVATDADSLGNFDYQKVIYETPIKTEEYLVEKNKQNDLLINYDSGGKSIYIILRKIKNSYKGIYIIGDQNMGDVLSENMFDNRIIVTNLDSVTFSKFDPLPYRTFKKDVYDSIKIDFSKKVKSLDFFDNIKFK